MYKNSPDQVTRRRGVVAVLVLVTLTLMLGFAALTVDVGMMYNVRADLQGAADAAAIAGASVLTTDEMMVVRNGGSDGYVRAQISVRADQFAGRNGTIGVSSLLTLPDDIIAGSLDLSSATATISSTCAGPNLNAVQVTVRCEEDSPNGPVRLFFAQILGRAETEISATAMAVFDDRVIGFEPPAVANPLVPFSVHEDVFNGGGPDVYGYDPDTQTITLGGDGVQEVNLYPHAEIGNGDFGLLNIGTPNQGNPALAVHIEDGVPPEDLEAEIGSSEVSFFDEYGDPVTYSITGNPGLHSALKSSLELREGEIIAVMVHDSAIGNGSNMTFHITGMRFARLMTTDLRGGTKYAWLQPVTYAGGGVRVGSSGTSSGGLVGKIVLVR